MTLRWLVALPLAAVFSACSAPYSVEISCADALKNGDETDVDCGGSCQNRCAPSRLCRAAGDCASGICANGACAAPSCFDGVANGFEGDVDCGTGCPTACADGKACRVAADCVAQSCVVGSSGAGVCAVGKVVELAAGGFHACARFAEGTVRCWGIEGALGDGTRLPRYAPRGAPIVLKGATALAACAQQTCAIVGGKPYCWGANAAGQLGNGSRNDALTPVAVSGLVDAVAIEVGADFACAIHGADRRVSCWGGNGSGQLGDGSTVARALPAAIPGLVGVEQLSLGAGYACAVLADGAVRCWGDNSSGQLGDGSVVTRLTPTAVPLGKPVARVLATVEGFVTVFVGQDGTVATTGTGPLGDGATSRKSPVFLPGIADGKAVAGSGGHFCLLRGDGSVVCWGRNVYGELGDGSQVAHPLPAPIVGAIRATDIVAGSYRSYGLDGVGGAVAWGNNSTGGLGTTEAPTGTEALSPMPVLF